jgi:hypothetical protein
VTPRDRGRGISGSGSPYRGVRIFQMNADAMDTLRKGVRSSTSLNTLLPRKRSPGSLHEGLDLVQGEAAIFVSVHSLEDLS